MRTVAFETSSRRGSVALLEGDQVIAEQEHELHNSHAEKMLPLLEAALEDAGWSRASVERCGVGIGPGSFTGLRVGVAFAQGVALGLGVPLVGVSSLAAMAAGGPPSLGLRCPILDARRGELFVAAYDSVGTERLAPQVCSPADAGALLAALGARVSLLGEAAALVSGPFERYRSNLTDLPHARWVGLLSTGMSPPSELRMAYVRDKVADRPAMPSDPLAAPFAPNAPAPGDPS